MTDPRTLAARAGIRRLSGLSDAQLDVRITGDGAHDAFTAHSADGVLRIEASTPAVALAAYAQFARKTGIGSVSRSGVRKPDALPEASAHLEAEAPYIARVAYNICVAGYTTPFFGWEEWETELDLLAASGVNAAHLTLGQEAVWLHAFQEFGYTEAELLAWIVPPSHQPWMWLNNIQSYGGGTTRAIIEKRVELARRVFARMVELEITPVLPGFSGSVPQGFADRNPGAPIVAQGKWFMDIAGPVRPDWLSSESEAYGQVAAAFYRAQRELFGLGGSWAVDLLHEGGKIGQSTLTEASQGVERAMRAADPEYTWYVQAWAGNPKQELLDALDTSRLLILDLTGEFWSTMDAYGGTPWAFGILPNYGGRTSLYGDLSAIAAAPAQLFGPDAHAGDIVGLTDMAEGVANNPVVWDLFHDLTWTREPIDLEAWLDEWVAARYGALTPAASEAWRILHATAYGPWRVPSPNVKATKESVLAIVDVPVDAASYGDAELPADKVSMFARDPLAEDDDSSAAEALQMAAIYSATDSILAAVPSLSANQASLVGPRVLHYDPGALAPALAGLIAAADAAPGPRSASLDHDLVDVARQVLVDHARIVLPRVAAAYEAADLAAFDAESAVFLELADEQEALLSSHSEFRLDTWLDAARAFASTPAEEAQLVEWAKRLVTCWGEREDFVLSEYATRDWAGLVGYYRERWAIWFAELRKVLTGEPTTPIDWYGVAERFVTSTEASAGPASADATPADPLTAAKRALAYVTGA